MAHFLRAVVLQFIVRPEPYAKPDPPESPISIEEADELSAAVSGRQQQEALVDDQCTQNSAS